MAKDAEAERLRAEAARFLAECYAELGKTPEELERRWREVERHIDEDGTYVHTYEELSHGAKVAWRNSNRCIGRLFWNTLHVFDAREAGTEEAIAARLLHHIDYATNGGRIRPAITVFAPMAPGGDRIRIRNRQLIRYAGYETADGFVGDPDSSAFTRLCQDLGWRGEGTAFDVLPLVVQIGERPPRWYDIPKAIVLEVPIRHPDVAGIDALGLRWYAVPIVSDMRLEIGGIDYTAAPFNGWYMGTEIGARNLADGDRYDMLPKVAEAMGLDRSREASLWKDRALVELNVAVLHSFRERDVSIVDHHTAAQQFARFEENESRAGRGVTGRWSWLVPPLSPATTHLFHKRFEDEIVTPNFFHSL
ncbi:nitric oxide synthase oxygenase [Paenibacillus sp. TRM 82003]|nr:nitric oxide synthase oxygenase [Paenibacillus sp. TRM 82003]